jgi:hypothetical protein
MTPANDYFRRTSEVARIDMDPTDEKPEDTALRDAIRENAMGPRRVQGDAGSVEQHSLRDQIEAEKFLAAKEATRRGLGIRLVKFKPDGTT